jgi:hypothetical protein
LGMPRGGEWIAVGCTRVFRLGGSRRPLGLSLPTHPPLSTRGTFRAILFAVICGHDVWCTGDTRAARCECATRVSCAPHFGTCLFGAAFDVRAIHIGGVVTVVEYRAGKRWRRARSAVRGDGDGDGVQP